MVLDGDVRLRADADRLTPRLTRLTRPTKLKGQPESAVICCSSLGTHAAAAPSAAAHHAGRAGAIDGGAVVCGCMVCRRAHPGPPLTRASLHFSLRSAGPAAPPSLGCTNGVERDTAIAPLAAAAAPDASGRACMRCCLCCRLGHGVSRHTQGRRAGDDLSRDAESRTQRMLEPP